MRNDTSWNNIGESANILTSYAWTLTTVLNLLQEGAHGAGGSELFKSHFLMMVCICAYANTHVYLIFSSVLWGCSSPPSDLRVLQLPRAPNPRGSWCQQWVAVALPRSLLREGRYVAPFTPPELYTTNVSMKSKRKSQGESVALAGFGNLRARFLSHCFPLTQSGGGVFLAAALTAGLVHRARTAPACQINRTLRLLTNSVLRPVWGGLFQSCAIVTFPLMCKAERE